jgi:hypothetical protein
MVNGLMSQLTTTVSPSPFQLRETYFNEEKSIWTIMGKIISQTKTATGMLTLATFQVLNCAT